VFLRNFEEKVVVFPGFPQSEDKLKDLESFIGNVILPSVFELDEKYFDKFLSLKRPSLILFRNDGLHDDAPFMDVYKKAALDHKGKILFAYADIAVGIQERLANFLDIKEENLPTLRALLPDGQRKFECSTPVD
jgi:hypothetical protein